MGSVEERVARLHAMQLALGLPRVLGPTDLDLMVQILEELVIREQYRVQVRKVGVA